MEYTTERTGHVLGGSQREGLSWMYSSVKDKYPLFFKRLRVMVVPKIGLYSN